MKPSPQPERPVRLVPRRVPITKAQPQPGEPYSQVVRALVAILEWYRRNLRRGVLRTVLNRPQPDVDGLPRTPPPVPDDLVDGVARAYRAGGRKEERRSGGPGVRQVDAEEWARRRVGELIVEIDTDTRMMVRRAIVDALSTGAGVRETADEIETMVGLHSRWAEAVRRRYRQALEAGRSNDGARDVAQRYASQLRRRRAELIARTELLRASNEGALQTYRQAQEQGTVGPSAVKVWMTADSPGGRRSKHYQRPCEICRPLHGMEVSGMDGLFLAGKGHVLAPPAHPACRCRIVLRPGSD